MGNSGKPLQERAAELKRQMRALGDRVNRHELTPAEAKVEFSRLESELAKIEAKLAKGGRGKG